MDGTGNITRAPSAAALAHSAGPKPADADAPHEAMESSSLVAIGLTAGFGSEALKVTRVVAKVPQMLRTHTLDKLPYYIGAGPDSNLLNTKIPVGTIAADGRSLSRADIGLMRSASLLAPALSGYQFISGALLMRNYTPGLGDEKPSDLVETRMGRSAMLQLAGGTWGSGLVIAGMRQAARTPHVAEAATPLGKAARTVLTATSTPVMLNPKLVGVGFLFTATIAANQFGYFDMLNRDDPRPLGTKLNDAVHSTWILNSPTLRPAVLGGIGALGLANAATSFVPAMKAAGGLSASGLGAGLAAVPKGKAALAGGVLALAGVSMLGGLDFLNG
jgi:hypothetical protein